MCRISFIGSQEVLRVRKRKTDPDNVVGEKNKIKKITVI